ncbi:hypothetical protein C0389_06870 [bacterium]|nr:hypothetical protein [bacterium]
MKKILLVCLMLSMFSVCFAGRFEEVSIKSADETSLTIPLANKYGFGSDDFKDPVVIYYGDGCCSDYVIVVFRKLLDKEIQDNKIRSLESMVEILRDKIKRLEEKGKK